MKKRGMYIVGALALMGGVPFVAFAQFAKTTLLVSNFGGIVQMGVSIAAMAALLVFFWGIAKYIHSSADPKGALEGKKIMLNGVIALFVLFSIFGLIRFLRTEFTVNLNSDLSAPQVLP